MTTPGPLRGRGFSRIASRPGCRTGYDAAVQLYDNAAWTPAGTATLLLPDSTTTDEFDYLRTDQPGG